MDKKDNETTKKRVGRPTKEKRNEGYNTNENTKSIRMASILDNNTTITLPQVQNAWATVLSKYGANLDPSTIKTAYQWSMTKNPFLQNERVKNINSKAYKKDKADVQKALQNPPNSEQALREISMSLYFSNFVYNNLMRLEREIPCYYSYILPQYLEKDEMKKDTFKKDSQFAQKILSAFNPQLNFKTINMQVQLEGKSSYLIRKSYDYPKKVDFFLLQKLMPDEVKITGIGSKQQYTVSFNMMVFLNPMYDVSLYPPYIQQIWEDMIENGMIKTDVKTNRNYFVPQATLAANHVLECINNTYFYWVDLHQDDCFTFGQDLATPMCFPQTIGLFMDLKELEDYRWLMGSLMSKGITSILTAEVPLAKDAEAGSDATVITPDLITFYDRMFNQTVSNNVMTYFGPFKNFDLHTIDSQPDNMNIIYNRLRDLIATSGNSALISINDKPSISMTKATQAIAASRANYLTLQFEQFLNNVINNQFDLKYDYKVTLWGDIFDVNGELKMAKELLQNGHINMLPRVMSAFGQSVEDIKTTNDYIEVMGIKLNTDTINNINSSETNVETNKQPVGRPRTEEIDIENDSTATSVDSGGNVSDIKEF